jgi:hypothetical protein
VTPADIAVLAIGLALIAGELWFFLGPRPGAGRTPDGTVRARAKPAAGDHQHG